MPLVLPLDQLQDFSTPSISGIPFNRLSSATPILPTASPEVLQKPPQKATNVLQNISFTQALPDDEAPTPLLSLSTPITISPSTTTVQVVSVTSNDLVAAKTSMSSRLSIPSAVLFVQSTTQTLNSVLQSSTPSPSATLRKSTSRPPTPTFQATDLVIAYSSISSEPTITAFTALPPLFTDPPNTEPEPSSIASYRQVIILGCILLAFLVFILISFILARSQCSSLCCIRKRWIDHGLDRCIEKDMEQKGSWARLSSLNSLTPQVHQDHFAPYSPKLMQDREIARLQNRVIDIVADFPRSRFSVTSSDLGSIHETFQIGDAEEDLSYDGRSDASLLPPAEFFSLPSSSTITSSHSRRNSAPVFGRRRRVAGLSMASYRLSRSKSLKLEADSMDNLHRKSRSVSGLGGDGRWL